MALTATQKLQAKKHMNVWPNDTLIDAQIASLEDGSVKETELTTAIALCETRYAAIQTAEVASDELVEGGGAKFSYERYIAIRKGAYRRSQEDLVRLLGMELPDGASTMAVGWRVD